MADTKLRNNRDWSNPSCGSYSCYKKYDRNEKRGGCHLLNADKEVLKTN